MDKVVSLVESYFLSMESNSSPVGAGISSTVTRHLSTKTLPSFVVLAPNNMAAPSPIPFNARGPHFCGAPPSGKYFDVGELELSNRCQKWQVLINKSSKMLSRATILSRQLFRANAFHTAAPCQAKVAVVRPDMYIYLVFLSIFYWAFVACMLFSCYDLWDTGCTSLHGDPNHPE